MCLCDNGMIECPACSKSTRYKDRYICAGCKGKGVRVCGKCGGDPSRWRDKMIDQILNNNLKN